MRARLYPHHALPDAHVRGLDQLNDRTGGDAYNLGTGAGVSICAVLEAVERVAGRPVSHSKGARCPGDPAELVSDPAKAMEKHGLTPPSSDLDTIDATAWAWHCRNG